METISLRSYQEPSWMLWLCFVLILRLIRPLFWLPWQQISCHGNQCLKPDSVPVPDLPAKFGANRSVNGWGDVEQTYRRQIQIIVWWHRYGCYSGQTPCPEQSDVPGRTDRQMAGRVDRQTVVRAGGRAGAQADKWIPYLFIWHDIDVVVTPVKLHVPSNWVSRINIHRLIFVSFSLRFYHHLKIWENNRELEL